MAARALYHGVDAEETLQAAASRWQTLGDDAVLKEIASFRAAATAALREARANGVDCASDEELELDADGGADDADDTRDAAGAAGGSGEGAEADAEAGAQLCAPAFHFLSCPAACAR